MNEDSGFSNVPSHNNGFSDSSDYLKRAAFAVEAGDALLGIHLYLAAYEQSLLENFVPNDETLEGLRAAWDLAVAGRQHSLAEFIFEKLRPYVSPDELSRKADELQDIALDRLEEFGFSRDAIEGMAELINEDIMNLDPDLLYRFEESAAESPLSMLNFMNDQHPSSLDEELEELLHPSHDAHIIENEGEEGFVPRHPSEDPELMNAPEDLSEGPQGVPGMGAPGAAPSGPTDEPLDVPAFPLPNLKGAKITHIELPKKKKHKKKPQEPQFDYSTIYGFDSVIEKMKQLGIGRLRDPEFMEFVKMLNDRHGVSRMPQLGTLVFTSSAREDANYFMVATVGEMQVPCVRMRMDQNMSGQSVLCVMASPDAAMSPQQLNRFGFEGPAALILEDLDLWEMPWMDMGPGPGDMPDFLAMQLSRGAREAMAFIQQALENPDVTVLISAANLDALDALFGPILGMYRTVELDLPNTEERKQIWRHAQAEHPSMRGLDLQQMVPFSKGLSRFELYAVITESVEQAYRRSIAKDCFCAVRSDDVLIRLSNFHDLDSKEYKAIEEVVLERFHRLMKNIDDILEEDVD